MAQDGTPQKKPGHRYATEEDFARIAEARKNRRYGYAVDLGQHYGSRTQDWSRVRPTCPSCGDALSADAACTRCSDAAKKRRAKARRRRKKDRKPANPN